GACGVVSSKDDQGVYAGTAGNRGLSEREPPVYRPLFKPRPIVQPVISATAIFSGTEFGCRSVAWRRPRCGRKTLHRTVVAMPPLSGVYGLAHARPGLGMDGLPARDGVHGQGACAFIAAAGHWRRLDDCRLEQACGRSAIPEC